LPELGNRAQEDEETPREKGNDIAADE